MNVRGRFCGLVECLIYQAPNAAARVASAANRPLPSAGGQKTPRRARGFPMWTFLTINPRAGRNSRRYPRKFRARGAGKNPQSAAAWRLRSVRAAPESGHRQRRRACRLCAMNGRSITAHYAKASASTPHGGSLSITNASFLAEALESAIERTNCRRS